MRNQDVWNFNISKGKHTAKVCVHLDLEEEPSEELIVQDLVKYIMALEKIKYCA
ncbi:TPA: hypothetical protein IAA86_04760 [Candidatus Galligastranaerophilus intestinavium]|uniref:Uncharacterized protein n=1 Tax=Candidatus Galligastranaerophilus intestinavium TaxID=2840836 RepID=A0A9D1JXN8_9BACT|nr:hypothetical protein [Candidatus Galligastranaerophilus intestinavium]